jgi:DNA-binding beta-propeller fold protein YncE
MKTQTNVPWTASLLGLLCLALSLAAPTSTTAAPLIYSTADKGALLVTTDFATGETKVIGPTGQILATGLACSGSGTLYTFTHAFDTTGESQLARFDLTTGEAMPYGEKNGLQLMGLTFTRDGTLLGASWTDGALYSINLTTGAPTKVGDLGDARGVMDLTIHPNGNMYGIDESGAIFQIDPKTAKATLAVKISGLDRPMGLGFDADGTGYVVGIVPQAPVYRIDLTTGQITGTVNTTLNFLHSAEFMVTPRPRLNFARQSDHLVLSWPSAMNCSLQASDGLGNGASWADVTTPAMPVGDQINVTESLLGSHRFFRLIQR